MRTLRPAAASIAFLLLATACSGDDPAPRKNAANGKAKQSLPSGGVWLAVLRIEDDPNLLDRDTETLYKPAGRMLVVAQVACFDGIEDAIDVPDEEGGEGAEDDTTPGTYVLGLKSTDKKKIRRVLRKVDMDPIAIAPVVDTCLGD